MLLHILGVSRKKKVNQLYKSFFVKIFLIDGKVFRYIYIHTFEEKLLEVDERNYPFLLLLFGKTKCSVLLNF